MLSVQITSFLSNQSNQSGHQWNLVSLKKRFLKRLTCAILMYTHYTYYIQTIFEALNNLKKKCSHKDMAQNGTKKNKVKYNISFFTEKL